jgi:hypothetical protein
LSHPIGLGFLVQESHLGLSNRLLFSVGKGFASNLERHLAITSLKEKIDSKMIKVPPASKYRLKKVKMTLQSENPQPLMQVAESGQQIFTNQFSEDAVNREVAKVSSRLPLPQANSMLVRAKMEMTDEERQSGHPIDQVEVKQQDMAEQEQAIRAAKEKEEYKRNKMELMKLMMARLGGGAMGNLAGAGNGMGVANPVATPANPLPGRPMPPRNATPPANNLLTPAPPASMTSQSMTPPPPMLPRAPDPNSALVNRLRQISAAEVRAGISDTPSSVNEDEIETPVRRLVVPFNPDDEDDEPVSLARPPMSRRRFAPAPDIVSYFGTSQ